MARRFSDADQLEAEARKDPLPVLKLLFKDLGPKTAQDIKEEMMDLVIPEEDWVKWWQGARTRLKKDPLIEVPESAKKPFYIRSKEKSLDEEAKEVLDKKRKYCSVHTNSLQLYPRLSARAKVGHHPRRNRVDPFRKNERQDPLSRS